ncbi:hypothetical protein OG828_39610 [Streptomyces sp. NBC_00457]|uniref:hypothetical protein n=1 Tax=unclassified Streptomyces TaxID=2593676 RepID=UPI002E1F2FEF|nr:MULTISPECIES: hypothetical protein [unclassified Streptomyces]
MTRRTRKLLVTGAALATVTLAGGGIALAADGDEAPRENVRFVVTDHDDCPEKNTAANGGAAL